MKTKLTFITCLLVIVLLALAAGLIQAQGPEPPENVSIQAAVGTAFTYQGQLKKAGSPISGTCDFQFSLWDAATSGSQVGTTQTRTGVQVSNGLFTIPDLDFGAGAFQGDARWLQIAVKCTGDSSYVTLSPRQPLTAAPYALFSKAAPWSGLTGIPAGFADGVDNDSGGDITGVTAGTGLSGGGTSGNVTLSADTTYLQRRVSGVCSSGNAIRVINADGTVTCEPVAGGAGDITAVYAGVGLTGGGESGAVTLTVSFAGSGSANTVARSDHDHDGRYWKLTGNAGTTPGTHFLGTSDNRALELKVNNQRILRLEPNNNLIGGHSYNSAGAGVIGATIGGGGSNTSPNNVTANYGTVGGGFSNTAGGFVSTVGGGRGNTASSDDVTVGGGAANNASGQAATIAGGNQNTASGYATTVSGGGNNKALTDGAVVGGGMNNTVRGGNAVISGGAYNTISATVAVIGGGHSNVITGTASYSTIGGGESNTASSWHAVVGGGRHNTASGSWSTIGGGEWNTASGIDATIGGGNGNTASGNYATVGGGKNNTAAGNYSFAAGRRAQANHTGAFVWADSTDADFPSTADNQFAVRATGGVAITTGSAGFLVNGNTVWHAGNDGPGSGLDADTLDGQHASAFASAALLGSSYVSEGSTTQERLFSMSTTGWAVLTDGDTDWDHTLVITTTNLTVEYTLWYGGTVVHGEAKEGLPATITFPHYQGFQLILARHQYIASLVCNENDSIVACVYQKSHP